MLQLLVFLPLAALPRISAAASDHGMLWPDEIYQTVEQAHRLAFGYGLKPWEFSDGLRSWALPGALSLVMRAASGLGAHSGLALTTTVKVVLALLGVASVGASMLLAWRLAGPAGSLLAGGLTVPFPMLLVYGPHPFAETVSACLVVFAAALALGRGRRVGWGAGVLAALATVVRPQNAIVAIGILMMLLARRDRGAVRRYVVAAGAVALLAGLLDWATWGAPFASFWRYLRFNVLEGGAGAFGTSSWAYYLRHILSANGPFVLLVGAGLVVAARRAPWLVGTVVSSVLVHSLVGHKELRFVLPVVPLALGLAGAGLGVALDAAPAWKARLSQHRLGATRVAWTSPAVLALAALLATGFAYSAGRETLGRLGEPRPELSRDSPWHHVESWNRLLSTAGRQPSVCGVELAPLNIVFTGGYSYLHRDVPLFNGDWMAIRNGGEPPRSVNELIVPTDYPVPAGFREVAREGDAHLLTREGGCDDPPPGYSRILPRPPALSQGL
jgi:GPI mannosyltransferase 3